MECNAIIFQSFVNTLTMDEPGYDAERTCRRKPAEAIADRRYIRCEFQNTENLKYAP